MIIKTDKIQKISDERLKDIENIKDEDIDFSDIPKLDDTFWENAKIIKPKNFK